MMRNILNKFFDKHDLINKILIFILVFITLVYVIPKEGKFKYEYNKGKRWTYNDLIAPYDFSILKTEDQIQKEKAQIYLNTLPIYYYDSVILKKVISDMDKELILNLKTSGLAQDKNQRLYSEYRTICSHIADSIYAYGFIDLNKQFSSSFVTVVKNSYAKDVNKNRFVSKNNLKNKINQLLLYAPSDINKNLIVKTLVNTLMPNIYYNSNLTQKLLNQKYEDISPVSGLITKGDLIIAKGSVVNEEKYQILNSFKLVYEDIEGYQFKYFDVLTGHAIMVLVSLLIILFYIKTYNPEILRNNRAVLFIFSVVILMMVLTVLVVKNGYMPIFIVPFCVLPILIRVFFDSRLALFVHLITVLLIGNILPNAFEFVLLQITAGIFAVMTVLHLRNRTRLFITSLVIFGVYSLVFVANNILQEGNLADVKWITLVIFFANAFLTLFTYPLIYIFERVFGFVTDVTLLELSDTNSKLMRELAEKAPGTFQHSIQVANLAEEAIFQIGGNPLLIRAGALYHDIGKMDMPHYFIENQVFGANPHEDMSYKESAKLIISHVIRGIEKAKKYNVPDQVIDFIRTHHGTSKARYFYQMHKLHFDNEQVDDNDFMYKGPIPYSRETAVLMMADSVEAASRSMKEKTPEAIETMIDQIISNQMNEGQYLNADITFKDITIVKNIFKKKIINAYHVRIEYPEVN